MGEMSAVVSPGRSYVQRLEALARANDVRSRRAQLKRDLAAGSMSVAAVLAEPPWWVGSMCVRDLLLAVPGCGPYKAGKVLHQLQVSPSRTVGLMSRRQRLELAFVMGERGS